jgi:hypothetical protein
VSAPETHDAAREGRREVSRGKHCDDRGDLLVIPDDEKVQRKIDGVPIMVRRRRSIVSLSGPSRKVFVELRSVSVAFYAVGMDVRVVVNSDMNVRAPVVPGGRIFMPVMDKTFGPQEKDQCEQGEESSSYHVHPIGDPKGKLNDFSFASKLRPKSPCLERRPHPYPATLPTQWQRV